MWRADSAEAAEAVRELIARTDGQPVPAHDYATRTPNSALPVQVQHLMQRRQMNLQRRRTKHAAWRQAARTMAEDLTTNRARHASRSLSADEGLEL
jgi:hypothetical protein